MKNKLLRASITVEAALVLPIFIFAMYVFIFLMQVLYVQEEIQQGLLQTARYCEKIGYVHDYIINYDVDTENSVEVNSSLEKQSKKDDTNRSTTNMQEVATYLITSGLMQGKFAEEVEREVINHSCIVGGMQGLNFLLSSYDIENNIAEITLQYKIHLPIGLVIIDDFLVTQKAKVRVFVGLRCVGEEEETSDDDCVYITETGTVYHESKDCTHLVLSISKIAQSTLDAQRNSFGAKYYVCEICKPDSKKQEYYYITKQGNRYHCNANCSGLKRTINVIKRSEVGNRRACTRCGKQ
ncbi:TadE/TadG family type IV pilus assembly protein [Anaerosporobacter sp.]|uniref:TadE/TadG family type IV pilus assembly protein n=1 Tax=Anaerosporobacter sp. TaxID=1872529 RepID=UPI00286F818A|nr:pilus assembly protein [Anaerosporobacter sp.]